MQIHEREPTNDELAEILDMDIDYFTEIHQTLLSRYNFINTPIGEEDIIITDIETDKNLIELSEYEESEKLIDEILNENEAEIIKLFCGFNESQDSYSLETISEKMGGVLTRERTRQIKNEAIRKLRIYYKYDFSDGNYSQSIKRKKRLKNILKVKDILGKQSIKTIIKAINITRKGEIGEQSNINDIYESMTICYTDKKKIQKAINTLFCNNKESIS